MNTYQFAYARCDTGTDFVSNEADSEIVKDNACQIMLTYLTPHSKEIQP